MNQEVLMRKLFVIGLIVFVMGLIALLSSACANRGVVNTTPQRRVIMWQVGVRVHVVNNCAPLLDLERDGRVEIKDLPYGESAQVPLVSGAFGGNNRQMFLIAKGYTVKNEYLGSATRTFYANTYEGSREEVWEVDRLNLPNGRGGCQ